MKKNLLLMMITLLFLACTKEESADYYYKKAEEKYLEIESLVKTYPCGDLKNWKIDAIGTSYFPIAISPNKDYLRLKKEYEALITKANQLDPRAMVYDFIYIPPIAVECVDGHPKVMTAKDYTLEKALIVLESKITEFETLTSNTTCKGTEQWILHRIIKDCKEEYFVSDLNDKNLTQNITQVTNAIFALQMQITYLDPSKRECYKYDNSIKSYHVKCENNIPIIQFER